MGKHEAITEEEPHIRALRIWGVLVYSAINWQIMRYEDLAKASGVWYEGPAMEVPLALLQSYCEREKLPPITALVVSVKEGKPSNWDDADMQGWHGALRRIFNHEWVRENAPSQDDLKG